LGQLASCLGHGAALHDCIAWAKHW